MFHHGKHEPERKRKALPDPLRTQLLEGVRELIVGVILILLELWLSAKLGT